MAAVQAGAGGRLHRHRLINPSYHTCGVGGSLTLGDPAPLLEASSMEQQVNKSPPVVFPARLTLCRQKSASRRYIGTNRDLGRPGELEQIFQANPTFCSARPQPQSQRCRILLRGRDMRGAVWRSASWGRGWKTGGRRALVAGKYRSAREMSPGGRR